MFNLQEEHADNLINVYLKGDPPQSSKTEKFAKYKRKCAPHYCSINNDIIVLLLYTCNCSCKITKSYEVFQCLGLFSKFSQLNCTYFKDLEIKSKLMLPDKVF